MEYRKIKDQEVSLLGFGCMRFPVKENGRIDEEAAFAMLNYAYENGVTYYDTAYNYHDGESEEVLGRWLKTIQRSSFCVATKMPLWHITNKEQIPDVFASQLEKLQVDCIDFYLMHSMNKEMWKKAQEYGLWDLLESYREAGKLRYIGFSFHDDYEVFEEIIKTYPWDFCQIQLNYMDEELQAGVKGLDLAIDMGVNVVVMEPLKGGFLAVLPEKESEMLKSESSDASTALRWLLEKGEMSTVLSGMSKLSDLQDNLNTVNNFVPLSAEEHARVNAVRKSLSEKELVACTACGYCLPCPADVNIPGCFRYLNIGNRYDNYPAARRNYGFNVGKNKASNCIDCQACVPQCPQHIDIPAMLKLVVEKLEK